MRPACWTTVFLGLPGGHRCCTCHRTPCHSLLRCRGSGTRHRWRSRRIQSPDPPLSRWRGSCCHGTVSPGPPLLAPLSVHLWAPPLEDRQGQSPPRSEKPQQTPLGLQQSTLNALITNLGRERDAHSCRYQISLDSSIWILEWMKPLKFCILPMWSSSLLTACSQYRSMSSRS